MGVTALLSHRTAASVVAYRAGRPVSAAQFLADARALLQRLPAGRHVLNACADRYRFVVGLAACLMSERVSLLPSTQTPEVMRQLAQFAPGAFCLTDEPDCAIELPQFRYPEVGHLQNGALPGLALPGLALPGLAADLPAADEYRSPMIDDEQLAAIVFTSGSTGTPLPYRKTWGRLAHSVRHAGERLGVLDGRAHTVVGTVPPQHMYGFESTALLPLRSASAFTAERPFYPADVCAAIGAAPRPRVLVTTPVHLRTLLAAGLHLPEADLIVSATAPLARELALQAEHAFRSRLLEIYGSTETGQIAMRRPTQGETFRLWPGVRLRTDNGQVYAHGGHVEQMTALCDVLELKSADEFILHGRTADLVNVAGKRSSFGYLNAQLNAIPGVEDGVFFLREGEAAGFTGIARLAAAVVAPGLSVASIMGQLRGRIDPVFLPRPLVVVDRLPRNATGKLPQQALQALADRKRRTRGKIKSASQASPQRP
ncbi:MAG TPA: AMP-binding protein [Steroidobacteraceae bacterium]|nr:AMP-binding protein [Steroidobacteraceae bacterium]